MTIKLTPKLREEFIHALPNFDERTRMIIVMKFGIDCPAKRNKFIAKTLHVSLARISQMFSVALRKVETDKLPGETKAILHCIAELDDLKDPKRGDEYHFYTVEACQQKLRVLLAEAKER